MAQLAVLLVLGAAVWPTGERACPRPNVPGIETLRIQAGGQPRVVHVAVGPRAAQGPAPLVLLWHGFGSSGRRILRGTEITRWWPRAVVVAAEGLGRRFEQVFGQVERQGWQVALGELGDRDLALFDALMAELVDGTGAAPPRLCVDPDRIYSAGFSNGAFFTNVLGCHRGERLAAIATVGGGGPFDLPCRAPVAVHISHGTSDRIVPFRFAEGSFERWVHANACVLPFADPRREGCRAASPACAAPVEICTHGGGHVWTRGDTREVIAFFRRQGRRPRRVQR